MAAFSSGIQVEWREVEGGQLAQPRRGPRVTLVGDILFLTGGFDGNHELTSILAWDPVAESWQAGGDLALWRYNHAAVAVPTSLVQC